MSFVAQRLQQHGSQIPHNFVLTAPGHDPGQKSSGSMPHHALKNPQTIAFLELLGLDYNLDVSRGMRFMPWVVTSHPLSCALTPASDNEHPCCCNWKTAWCLVGGPSTAESQHLCPSIVDGCQASPTPGSSETAQATCRFQMLDASSLLTMSIAQGQA